MKSARILLLHAQTPYNETLSYQRAWPRHFAAHPRFSCVSVDVLAPNANRLARLLMRLAGRRFDSVVLLHSVFSSTNFLHGRLLDAVQRSPLPKAYFIGNEYKAMPAKLRLCEDLGIDVLVSQFTTEEPLRLYRERLPKTLVVGIPNTGWDPDVYRARTPPDERPIDLGYRAFENELALGHRERRELAERIEAHANELRLDVSLAPEDRFDEPGW